jgi:hypothetical protein
MVLNDIQAFEEITPITTFPERSSNCTSSTTLGECTHLNSAELRIFLTKPLLKVHVQLIIRKWRN